MFMHVIELALVENVIRYLLTSYNRFLHADLTATWSRTLHVNYEIGDHWTIHDFIVRDAAFRPQTQAMSKRKTLCEWVSRMGNSACVCLYVCVCVLICGWYGA